MYKLSLTGWQGVVCDLVMIVLMVMIDVIVKTNRVGHWRSWTRPSSSTELKFMRLGISTKNLKLDSIP
jgi:hypothetical protein